MAASWHHKRNMPSMEGKIAFITGGNGGIGYETVVCLAKAGCKVYFGARSAAKAEAAIERLHRENPGVAAGQVAFVEVDMASTKSVVAAADSFVKRESRLDLLINNAAHEGSGPTTMSDSGAQISMQTNHVNVFVLTQKLEPLLRTAAKEKDSDVRIVMVSSDTAAVTHSQDWRPDFSDPHGGDLIYPDGQTEGFMAAVARYSVTKVAVNLQARELQARYDRESVPILVVSVCPGSIWTPGTRRVAPWYLYWLMWLKSYRIDEGPKSLLFAGASREARDQERYYAGQFTNRTNLVVPGHPAMNSAVLARQLWESTETLVNEFYEKNA